MVTKQEELDAFLAEERVEGFYEALTDEEKIARNITYTALKIAVDIEKKKKADFYAQRDIAFEELAQQHNEEKIALGQLWQTYEDNNYIIE